MLRKVEKMTDFSLGHWLVAGMPPERLQEKRHLNQPGVPIDGRPRFAKRSINDDQKVKIAAIDPDFA